MSILEHILLIGSILFVGLVAMAIAGKVKKMPKEWLAFSGAFLVSITFLHLFPIIFENGGHHPGIWIMAGFFGQLFLERFSSGIEHGHLHNHDHRNANFLILQVMLGLTIHSFAEGLSLGGFEETLHSGQHERFMINGMNPLLIGIILHHAPAAFALIMVLKSSGISRSISIIYLVFFAITPSLGALTMSNFNFDTNIIRNVLAVVSGSFLHVATTILFETDNMEHKVPYRNLLASLLGVLLSLLTI